MILTRFLRHFLVFVALVLPLTVVGWIILYPVLLCLPREANNLPRFLRWFDNVDNDGLIGDRANQERNYKLGIDPFGDFAKYKWIAFRNPVQGFKYLFLGINILDIGYIVAENKPDIGGEIVGDYTSGGTLFATTFNGARKYYEYYLIKPHRIFNKNLCIRARFGWKLAGLGDKPRTHVSWTFAFNPVHTYRGKYVD